MEHLVQHDLVAALRQDTWVDYAVRIFSIAGLATPSFWLGIVFILLLLMALLTADGGAGGVARAVSAAKARIGRAARLVVDVALALLLFEIGSRVRLRWLRNNPGLMATSVLESAAELAARNGASFDHAELYSCFPCVPKMARRVVSGVGTTSQCPLRSIRNRRSI